MNTLFRDWCASRLAGPLQSATVVCAFALTIVLSTPSAQAAVLVKTLGGGPNQAGPGRTGAQDGDTLTFAKFNGPSDLATDSSGNLFVADRNNGKIRKVSNPGGTSLTSTFVAGLRAPVGVAVDRANVVYVITQLDGRLRKYSSTGSLLETVSGLINPTALTLDNDGNVYVTELAGTVRVIAPDGSISLVTSGLNRPRGIALLTSGLLAVSESGAHRIDLVDPLTGATTLLAGGNGRGFADGPGTTARFNQPWGVAAAPNGAVVVADRLNHRVRVVDTNGVVSTLYGVPRSQWHTPFAGWVDGAGGVDGTAAARDPVGVTVGTNATVYVTELGWQLIRQATGTGLNSSHTEVNLNGPTITCLGDISVGVTNNSRTTVNFLLPNVVASGVANVVCVPPPGSIFESGITTVNCEAWDASLITNRCSFDVQVVVTVAPNTISFGFEAGEASSEFIGAAGQHFYAPVTLRVGGGQSIYSFQMSLSVTQEMGAPVALPSSALTFKSMVDKREDVITRNDFFIPPVFTTNTYYVPITNNVQFRNDAISMLGVGWLTRFQETNLYNTKVQDLITYSIAKDTLLGKAQGKVIFGAYGIQIPSTATPSDTFLIKISNPSGTSDGVTTPVQLNIPTDGSYSNGAPNTIKRVVLGSRSYVVGDSTPFGWFNAGDFGDTNLANSDVMDVFQSAVYSLNTAIEDSDLFNAMDSANGSALTTPSAFFNGDAVYTAALINSVTDYDGRLNLDDVFVTFRRSLDPTLTWYERYWTNGTRQFRVGSNSLSGGAGGNKSIITLRKTTSGKSLERPVLTVGVDDVLASPAAVLQLPIRVQVEAYALRTLLMNVSVEALDGSPGIVDNIQVQMTPTFGAPDISDSRSVNNLAGAWLDNQIAGIAGNSVLAILSVRVPAGAGPHAAYRVHFDHFSGSPNGVALFQTRTSSGLILLSDRSASTWADGLSDEWRLRYFGSIYAPDAAPAADADADGVLNSDEYVNGTDPTDPTSH